MAYNGYTQWWVYYSLFLSFDVSHSPATEVPAGMLAVALVDLRPHCLDQGAEPWCVCGVCGVRMCVFMVCVCMYVCVVNGCVCVCVCVCV